MLKQYEDSNGFLDMYLYSYEGNTRRCEYYFNGKHSDYYDITRI